jgi:phage-related protein
MKQIIWIGTSRADLREFPEAVREHVGFALYLAQCGDKHPDAKILRGFGGAGVVEVVSDYRGDTFRTAYTVRYRDAIYVLHAFQKKSKSGRETPPREMELVEKRLRIAEKLATGI